MFCVIKPPLSILRHTFAALLYKMDTSHLTSSCHLIQSSTSHNVISICNMALSMLIRARKMADLDIVKPHYSWQKGPDSLYSGENGSGHRKRYGSSRL